MSYSVDLWNSFDSIGNLLLSNLKGIKNLYEIFNSLYISLESFSSSLKDIYNDYNYEISVHKSLYESALFFKEDFLNCYNYIIDLMLGLKKEIMNPLENIRIKILNKYLKYKEGLNALEEEYEEYINNVNESKNEFYKGVMDLEDFKINYEYQKKNCNLNGYKKEEEEKINELLKIAKENQKKYVVSINRINQIQNDYIEQKKNYLNNMQYMEEQLGLYIKDSLRKFILFKISFLRNMQYDVENISKKFDEIDINKDIKDFIVQNSTNDLIPFKYEFVPYNTNYKKYKNKNISNTIIKEVFDFINTIFNNDTAIINYIVPMNKNKNSINAKDIAEYIFRINNNKYQDKDNYYKKKIEEFFRDKKKRKNLLQEMNNLRIKGDIFINEFNFDNIALNLKLCIKYILEEYKKEEEMDYESINLIFIISTNLYKMGEYGNKPRIFLQEKMTDVQIFSEFEFWKLIIRYFIVNEMHLNKNFNLFESNENKNIENQKLIKNQINKFIYHMKAFKVKNKIINEIILFFKDYYNLENKNIEELLIKENKNKDNNDDNDNNNFFLLENDKEEGEPGDNNFVINIPNVSSINSIHDKII
jgi:hypothetical protein